MSSALNDVQMRTLYVGNLHPSMNELPILQLFGRHGKINSIRYLWHIVGPQKGKPRGYCFLEFDKREDAAEAIKQLNDKPVKSYPLLVKFYEHFEQTNKETINVAVLKGTTDDKIKALEEKLEQMKDPRAVTSSATTPAVSAAKRGVGLMAMLEQSNTIDKRDHKDRRHRPY